MTGWRLDAPEGGLRLTGHGAWTADHALILESALGGYDPPPGHGRAALVELSALDARDAVGVWVAASLAARLEAAGWVVAIEAGKRAGLFAQLYAAQRAAEADLRLERRRRNLGDRLARFGAGVLIGLRDVGAFLGFVGLAAETLGRVILRPRRFRLNATLAQIDRVGVRAIPIIAVLMFLVGLVLAYQSVDQFRRFAAEPLAVNILAITMLREFGVLITAIIVAGRSGSAFCAEIGFMKANEEIDALRAIGVDPIEALVLPRLIGAVIAVPLLTVLADVMGVLGGAVYIALAVDMSGAQVLERIHDAVVPETFLLGVAKAPVFAALIALVGCYKGASASGGAESVGRKTTEAVVMAIFLVLTANALFSVIFALVGL